ncbi:hypothetical protein K0A97_01170 [Patescibacteria group bacterium]|nr:hypothetical protein [Patescibacteria group bacterium]
MKTKRRGLKFYLIFLILIFSLTISSACTLDVILINQEPYPVSPGESVKVLFQVTGVGSSDCGLVRLKVMENFPFTIDPSMSPEKTIQSGVFAIGYNYNSWTVPYTIRVSKDAERGLNELDILVSKNGATGGVIQSFDIEIEEVKTEFEVYIRDYNSLSKTLTLSVMNVGKNNVESLLIELPEQETLDVIGSNKQTIGILDSNEDTTVRFSVSEVKEGRLKLIIRYNDVINERREVIKEISFNPKLFKLEEEKKGLSFSNYFLIIVVIAIVGYCFYKRKKSRKKLKEKKF